ncbi:MULTISPECIES: type II toxin-antitoxin system RatA family toxin [Streptomyces]|uniref:Cyclase n=2 Tax=Streptomyces TaxID=1883 RepID=A0A646KAU3_STRJU|nr:MULTISPECIES: SRPBCC family protein [Streptomyces]MQS35812.1 cyclase [Streptomyces katsurahamanus]MQS99026.1 cyclase [Streptomyces jumonjinensis]
MRHVELAALVKGAKAEDVQAALAAWERYPELAPHVRATTVHSGFPEETGSSSWELHFRSGLLRWTEDDVFDVTALKTSFTQSDGDFEEFDGVWSFRQQDDDVLVEFAGDFDFGIPSLEGILDPIAERVIKETVAFAIAGSFPSVTVLGEESGGGSDAMQEPAQPAAARG